MREAEIDAQARKDGWNPEQTAAAPADEEAERANHFGPGLPAQLARLNTEYAYLRSPPGRIFRFRDGEILTQKEFELEVAPRKGLAKAKKGDIEVPVGPTWIDWKERNEITRLIYEPRHVGQERQRGDRTYNLWRGWGCDPHKGNVEPFKKLMRHVVLDDRERDLLLSFLALALQEPGTKFAWAALVWSRMQGVGKSFIGELVSAIYGSASDENPTGNSYELATSEDLLGDWDYWVKNRQFVTVNEVHVADNRRHINKLKALLTAQFRSVKQKFVPEYQIRNRVNFFLTSQYSDALYLEKSDRRFLIIHANEAILPSSLVTELIAWKHSGEAGPALFHYLLTHPISDEVTPHGHAPYTAAKAEMQVETQSALENYCAQIIETEADQNARNGPMRHANSGRRAR